MFVKDGADDAQQSEFNIMKKYSLDSNMLGLITEDPKSRLFSDTEVFKEKFLKLRNMINVSYTYHLT